MREEEFAMGKAFDGEYFVDLTKRAVANNKVDPEFYDTFNVKRGLRNKDGTGVVVGLTEIGSVHGYLMEDAKKVPDIGKLSYRGIDVKELVKGFQTEKRRGYEETAYLLLFGELPKAGALSAFDDLLDANRELPPGIAENTILKSPSRDVMNKLARTFLVLYSYDEDPENLEIGNVLRQCIQLIARIPTIVSYGYQAKAHYFDGQSLYLHSPKSGIGTAENILRMIRPDMAYTRAEAEILDLCLVLHAEHGGGNNSTFALHVVSSTGTDTYSSIAAALGSLKGPKHGGANIEVKMMIDDIKANCADWGNKSNLRDYLVKILKKEAYNRQGLIYGMGHAVYTKSDPRAVLLKGQAFALAKEKGREEEFSLYANIEECGVELLKEMKGPNFVISANVDLYSGFVYGLLGIPSEIYTPLFATARMAGWCAHLIECLISDPKIMRPAYVDVSPKRSYLPLSERK
jgi:citrate synthase